MCFARGAKCGAFGANGLTASDPAIAGLDKNAGIMKIYDPILQAIQSGKAPSGASSRSLSV